MTNGLLLTSRVSQIFLPIIPIIVLVTLAVWEILSTLTMLTKHEKIRHNDHCELELFSQKRKYFCLVFNQVEDNQQTEMAKQFIGILCHHTSNFKVSRIAKSNDSKIKSRNFDDDF